MKKTLLFDTYPDCERLRFITPPAGNGSCLDQMLAQAQHQIRDV
jgi:hypothetical protein